MADTEEVISDFMGENPRASELRQMRDALADRLRSAREDRLMEDDPQKRAALATQIKTLERQIDALKTEEVVSEFVEHSVRVTLAKSTNRFVDEGEEEE